MKNILIILVSFSFVLGASSCKLFKKTNKCDTCPSWKAEIKTSKIKRAKV